MTPRSAVLVAAAWWALVPAGCYTLGAPAPREARLFVEVIDADGIDPDLGATVAVALRQAVAARPELSLVSRGEAEATLRLGLHASTTGLSPLADPARRAPEYRVVLRAEATVAGEGGSAWRSGVLVGEATYASDVRSIGALDGARRRALERAAEELARRVVGALLYTRAPG
jgi:hypothetical protein